MNRIKKKEKGFTLIELIIVIAVLGILSAIAIPKFSNVSKNAKKNTDIANAKIIAETTIRLLEEDKLPLPSGNSKGYGIDFNNSRPELETLLKEFNEKPTVQQYSDARFFVNVYVDGSVKVSAVNGGNGISKVIDDLYPQ